MKAFIPTLLLLTASFSSFAQRDQNNVFMWPEDPSTQRYVFKGNGYVPGATQESIYNTAKAFLARTFKSDKDSIVADDANKTIHAKCAYFIPVEKLGERGKGYISFTFSIKCSDRFYKFSLANFEHIALTENDLAGGWIENERPTAGGWVFPIQYWNDLKGKTYYHITTTIERLKEAMYKAE